MRTTVLLGIIIVCCTAASAQPLLTAYRAQTPPAIDGDLADACWQAASPTSAFVLWGHDALPEAQTIARVCFDDQRLYIAVEAMEPNLEPRLNMLDLVRADATGRDSRVFRDDCVEIFIQPGDEAYYQVVVNSIGTIYDGRGMDNAWDGEIEAAAKRGNTSYTFELAIDLASIGGAPEGTWRMNFCRNRTAVAESSTWSGLQGDFHQPAQFGEVLFAEAGPTIRDVSLQIAGETLTAVATMAGQAPTLTANVSAGANESSASVAGSGQRTLSVALPDGAADSGRVGVTWELTDGGTTFQRSAEIPLPVEAGATRLALTIRNATVGAWLNGEALPLQGGAVELGLQPGVNVLALQATADGEQPSVLPAVTALGRELPVSWLQRTDAPDEGWMTAIGTVGWQMTDAPAAWPEGERQRWLTCAIYLDEPKPQLFPKMDTFYVPLGSRQLMRLYAHIPQGVPTSGYRMVVDAPSALSYIEAETGGGTPPVVSAAGTWTDAGVPMTRYHADYDSLPGEGMEISLRWADDQNTTIAYEPSIGSGGTHDWRHVEMAVTAPGNAVSVHPLIIKWQGRGVTGTFWVDNLVFRRADSEENLLKMGTFDEPDWGNHHLLKPEGPDGSLCCRIVSTTEGADRQQALWVDKEQVTPVVPGERYVVEMDVRCEELISPTAKPVLGLLFEAAADLPEGVLPVYTAMQTLGGAITEIPRRSSVQILPPLRDVRPERARITPCYGSRGVTAPETAQAWADNTWASGMTWIWGNSRTNVAQLLLPQGLQVIYHLPWAGWNPVGEEMRAYIEEHAEVRAANFESKPQANFFCPTWFLSGEGARVRRMLIEWVKSAVAAETCSNVNWDLEQPVVDPPTFCTCERCMDAFRLRDDVPDDAVLSPEALLGEYRDRWVDYRCGQNAKAAAILSEAVHAVDPALEFSVYSGFQSTRTKEHYGVDWALMQPHIDMAIAGYGGSEDSVRATLEAMGGKPFMGGEMWYLSHREDSRPTPDMRTWCNRLLRKFVQSGCTGVLIWHLAPMEGGSFYATSEATALIAEHEDWLREDLRCDAKVSVEGLPVSDWAAFERDGEILVLLLNFAAEPKPVSVTIDGETRQVELAPYGREVLR